MKRVLHKAQNKLAAAQEQRGFRHKKSLGQCFLHSPAFIGRISQSITTSIHTSLIEIGPGHGALTASLLGKTYRSFRAIELDQACVRILQEKFSGELARGALEIILEDVREFDWQSLEGEKLVVCGNLPYYLAADFIMNILELQAFSSLQVERLVFLVQKEVAMRFAAGPGSKIFSRLSVQAQHLARIECGVEIPPEAFTPAPKVDSQLLILEPQKPTKMSREFYYAYKHFLKICFAEKRKQLQNLIKKSQYKQLLGRLPEDELLKRAEQISPKTYLQWFGLFMNLSKGLGIEEN